MWLLFTGAAQGKKGRILDEFQDIDLSESRFKKSNF